MTSFLNNIKCGRCQLDLVSQDAAVSSPIILTAKCHHFFHRRCFFDQMIHQIPSKDRKKKTQLLTPCPALSCSQKLKHRIQNNKKLPLGLEVIDVKDIFETKSDLLSHLATSMQTGDDEKKSFKKATMVLGAVLTASVVGVIFQTIASAAISLVLGYGFLYLSQKIIENFSLKESFSAICKKFATLF